MKTSNEKWLMFKNFLHNELEISKDDIREWIHEAVKEEAKLLVNKTFNSFDIREIIKNAVLIKDPYRDIGLNI
jgi:serine protease inhibitor